MSFKDFIYERKFAIAITFAIMLIGSTLYFMSGNAEASNEMAGAKSKIDSGIYNGIKFKAAYTPEGQLKIFALASSNTLAMLKAVEGNPLPETNSVVIGYDEADMMKSEKLFLKAGDSIIGLFGIDTKVGGVLAKTNSPIDDFHFLSETQFKSISGKEGKIFVRLNDEGAPKIFYSYRYSDNPPLKIKLKEGKITDYRIIAIAGQTYYPVILGAKEAEIMRSEGLFTNTGDMIKGFFGKNIIITGVLEETDTGLDMMHLIPLNTDELGEAP